MTWWQFLFLWLTQQGLNYEDDDEEDEEDDDGGDDHGGGGDDGGCGDNDHEDHEDGFTQQGLHDEMNLKLSFFKIFQMLHNSNFNQSCCKLLLI